MSALLAVKLLALAQFCPSYTLSSSGNTHSCGVEAVTGTNPSVAQWQTIFDLVAQGPSVWGSAGPAVTNLGEGCGKPQPTHSVPAQFPCELLKAITFQESGWRQFCKPTTPADQTGKPVQTIISFDCGYGIGQVTSGMHVGESPAFDRARVAADPTYNLATGTQILADKWRATKCVGDNQPALIEHWYYATWAYNGLAYVNNPHNSNFSSTRGVYNPSAGGAAPYQEKVFGWMQFPPSSAHWASTAVAYPKLSDIVDSSSSSALTALPDPSCASPTSCASTRAVHRSSCFPLPADGGLDAGHLDGGLLDGGHLDGGHLDAGSDGGHADAGHSDAGSDVDAGTPVILAAVPEGEATLRPAVGCHCGNGGGGAVALLTAWALRRRRRGCV